MTAAEKNSLFSTILLWPTRKTLRDKHTGWKRLWLQNTSKNANIRIEFSCLNRLECNRLFTAVGIL